MVSQPQFLLFCDTHPSQTTAPLQNQAIGGRWHFVLDRLDCPQRLEAADAESSIHPDRLALLSVVRGLEALDEPSQVNLVTTSRYVSRGLKYGLTTWRTSNYCWEHFGVQRPVRNADLWQRVDRAMRYHGLTCRLIQSQTAAELPVADESWDLAAEALSLQGSAFNPQELAAGQPGEIVMGFDGLPTAHTAPTELRAGILIDSGLLGRDRLPATAGRPRAEQALQPQAHNSWYSILVNWWEMAVSWLKWWRGRNQSHTAIFGT